MRICIAKGIFSFLFFIQICVEIHCYAKCLLYFVLPDNMNTSTPQSGGRQKPLSPGGEYLSPATRPQPVSAAGTPTLQNFTSNDDEWERKQRRRSRVIDLQLSNADSPASTISPAQR